MHRSAKSVSPAPLSRVLICHALSGTIRAISAQSPRLFPASDRLTLCEVNGQTHSGSSASAMMHVRRFASAHQAHIWSQVSQRVVDMAK